jgi:hypothetical protein
MRQKKVATHTPKEVTNARSSQMVGMSGMVPSGTSLKIFPLSVDQIGLNGPCAVSLAMGERELVTDTPPGAPWNANQTRAG